jgi:MFS family permease
VYSDGLWDFFLGCFVLMFAVAPLLSGGLGDFWSSAVFLPFWALVYLAVRLLRKRVVAPRLGTVKFGRARKTKLRKFSVVMLAVNVVALILGFVAASNVGRISGQAVTPFFGLVFLAGFSAAAYFLDFPRLYLYGFLMGLSPLVGEWLWARHLASHHGFPVTFGVTAAVMILVGLVLFVRLVRDNPVLVEGLPSEDA